MPSSLVTISLAFAMLKEGTLDRRGKGGWQGDKGDRGAL